MNSEKKCMNCNRWSQWNQSVDDTCQHCGALLDPEGKEKKEKRDEEARLQKEKWAFTIHEGDSPFRVFAKKLGNTSYIIFISIISFFAWLIAALPG
jgi:hypothetical protein